MTAAFDCTVPRQVLFGRGRLGEAGKVVRSRGRRALVLTGKDPVRARPLLESLAQTGVDIISRQTDGEPTFEAVRKHVADPGCPDVIVAYGGGSVIDTAKAVAMLLANGGDPMDYAEVIGGGQPISHPSIPLVAIPTTAGAGTEATRNAVLKEAERGMKVSLRSPLMLPEVVIIDPEVTVSLPSRITAATGMDALAQLIEPFVSIRANPFTDALCRAGIARAARSLERACSHPQDLTAREDMALASWWSGMALANAGLGAVHGFAAVLGGRTEAPHGYICAALLAPVCRANIDALRDLDRKHPVLNRYAEVAALLTGRREAAPEDAVDWLAQLAARLPLGTAAENGCSVSPSDDLLEAVLRSSSMKANPVPLSRKALAAALNETFA